MRTPRLLAGAILALGLVSLSIGAAVAQPSGPGTFDIDKIEGRIDPLMTQFNADRVASADMDGAKLVILRLNSPAAVGIDENEIEATVETTEVPVVAWVAPRGAVATGLADEIFELADARFAVDEAASLADLLEALDGTDLEG